MTLDVGHQNTMSVGIDWLRSRESVLVQSLHEDELFSRGDSRQIEPIVLGSSSEVISVIFDSSETCSTQSSEFENNDSPFLVFTQVNVYKPVR